jgi:hypothetical protein
VKLRVCGIPPEEHRPGSQQPPAVAMGLVWPTLRIDSVAPLAALTLRFSFGRGQMTSLRGHQLLKFFWFFTEPLEVLCRAVED